MSPIQTSRLRVEYRQNPLGIDVPKPRLSWWIESDACNVRQTACQILVASRRDLIDQDQGDLWDSGRIDSDETVLVPYGGAPLPPRSQCWWKVRAWDQNEVVGPYSEPSFWSMGLTGEHDWQAQWIGYDAPPPDLPEPVSLEDCPWVSLDETPAGPRSKGVVQGYRKTVVFDRPVTQVRMAFTGSDKVALHVNGIEVFRSEDRAAEWRWGYLEGITEYVAEGSNAVCLEGCFTFEHPTGVLGKLLVDFEDGSTEILHVDSTWRALESPPEGWTARDVDDTDWQSCYEHTTPPGRPFPYVNQAPLTMRPVPYLRREFQASEDIARATVYATALGLYEVQLNGERVGDELLRPGWSDYYTRLYYQAYDVTERVQSGANALGVRLGAGWFAGYLGWNPEPGVYGGEPRARVQLEIEYADGSTQVVMSDEKWRAAYGGIRRSDLYMGEEYDARREPIGWDSPGFDDQAWEPVVAGWTWEYQPVLEAYPGVPVRTTHELAPQAITETSDGAWIVDLGQNMVGYARLRVQGEAGDTITLRFAEMLNPDGTLYVTNLRAARCRDVVTLSGGKEEIFEPRFTFHGFRYVEVRGLRGKPSETTVTGVVIQSDIPDTSEFECDDPMINQLQHNIVWGQRGNYLEVPTDCPQRDERLGWMGDAQVFARTACFNTETGAFFTKWMRDVVDCQTESGSFPDIAPRITTPRVEFLISAPGWGDAGIICPWTIYRCYGDRDMLVTWYDAMRAWVDHLTRENPDGLWRNARGNDYGDWLNIDADAPRDLIGTAFYRHSADLLARIAGLLGKDDDARKYADLAVKVKQAFIDAYVQPDGHVHGETQTVYVLALHFDLLPEELRQPAAALLVERIKERDWHLSTGFLGCPYLLFALSDNGYPDVAFRLLKNDTFPSWGYSIRHGATTIWERWDGWTEDNGFQNPFMNSFNHYAYGAVGEWLYRVVAGVELDPDVPGYRKFIIQPTPGGGFSRFGVRYKSIRGPIASAWRLDGGQFTLEVTVPANTTATVVVPAPNAIEESGLTGVNTEADATRFEVGSGAYRFTAPITPNK